MVLYLTRVSPHYFNTLLFRKRKQRSEERLASGFPSFVGGLEPGNCDACPAFILKHFIAVNIILPPHPVRMPDMRAARPVIVRPIRPIKLAPVYPRVRNYPNARRPRYHSPQPKTIMVMFVSVNVSQILPNPVDKLHMRIIGNLRSNFHIHSHKAKRLITHSFHRAGACRDIPQVRIPFHTRNPMPRRAHNVFRAWTNIQPALLCISIG